MHHYVIHYMMNHPLLLELLYSGKFSLVQIFTYLAKKPWKCFNFVCQSYKTTPTYGQQGDLAAGLRAFLASVSIIQLIKSV